MEYKKNDIAKLERLLYRYREMIAEIKNIDIEIEYIKQHPDGVNSISYEEKSSPTNKFNSSVENEVIAIDKKIEMLKEQKAEQVYWTSKIDNALEVLDQRSKQIIEMKYFEKINNTKIATRLNLTEEWICKLKNDSLKQLFKLILIKN
ncbi:RNA polymerase subunit sigma [Clostridium sporogenes]|uniref:sigma factor-like helix-turn-helix DNA-binding protein n=1 Tax=Clostridium sporogenes TaxID=1509 RepID=UPI0015EE50CD|nr:sigma factor-like helix-turn-helix DNA-binding protein [Clostridium sporogenes]MBA4510205.1 RNA polymerase subunit sigma [Clostridium sporogenes]